MIVPKKNGKAANYGKLTAAIVAVCDGIRTMSGKSKFVTFGGNSVRIVLSFPLSGL